LLLLRDDLPPHAAPIKKHRCLLHALGAPSLTLSLEVEMADDCCCALKLEYLLQLPTSQL
jgi:hypothetical protein